MADPQKYTIHNAISFLFKTVRGTVSFAERWFYRAGILDRNQLHFPDFLGIGAQKAGTTWLYINMRHHPDIHLTIPKELHYFDWYYHEGLDSYSRRFDTDQFTVKGTVAGEITPDYSILRVRRIRFIHAMKPDLRLIFLMRNPIERTWSQAVMNLVAHSDRSFEDVPREAFIEHFHSDRSVKRSDYITIIDNWLSVFPEEQLYIGFLEDIVEHPRRLLSEVFQHIGVSTDVDWASFPYNQQIRSGIRSDIPPEYRKYLEEMYRDDIQRLAERFGGPADRWLERLRSSRS